MKTLSTLVTGALCLALGACGDDPSEWAMDQALNRAMAEAYQAQFAAAAFLTGGARGPAKPMPAITGFHKVSCQPAQPAAGHLCEYTVNVAGRELRDRGRFFKAPDGTLTMAAR